MFSFFAHIFRTLRSTYGKYGYRQKSIVRQGSIVRENFGYLCTELSMLLNACFDIRKHCRMHIAHLWGLFNAWFCANSAFMISRNLWRSFTFSSWLHLVSRQIFYRASFILSYNLSCSQLNASIKWFSKNMWSFLSNFQQQKKKNHIGNGLKSPYDFQPLLDLSEFSDRVGKKAYPISNTPLWNT